MENVKIAVKLITPDPQATTALNAIKDMRLQLPPLKLHRYDLWQFDVSSGGEETVAELVGHFTDIVNPNKQSWAFYKEENSFSEEDKELKWISIFVQDRKSSKSSNWTDLVKRRGFPVESLNYGVLWRFGYLIDTDDALVEKMALELAVSNSRTGGLLSNPVSQEVSLWN